MDSRLAKALSLILTVTLLGTVYFHLSLGLDWVEAAYQVVITLSTVGYETPASGVLSSRDKIVIMLMIPVGVGSAAYVASLMVSHVVEGELAALLENRKMTKQIETLERHVLVCGLGGIGRRAALELREAGRDVVVVDRDEELLEEFRNGGFLTLEGDATEEAVLTDAGVERADVLVATLSNDAECVFLTLTARFLNSRIRIIARGTDKNVERKLKRAGANIVVLPSLIGGRRMAQAVLKPNVLDFVDLTTGLGDHTLRLDELELGRSCDFAGMTIEDSNFRQRFGLIIVAVRKSDGVMRFNPSGQMVFEAGDILVTLGEASSIERLKAEAT